MPLIYRLGKDNIMTKVQRLLLFQQLAGKEDLRAVVRSVFNTNTPLSLPLPTVPSAKCQQCMKTLKVILPFQFAVAHTGRCFGCNNLRQAKMLKYHSCCGILNQAFTQNHSHYGMFYHLSVHNHHGTIK